MKNRGIFDLVVVVAGCAAILAKLRMGYIVFFLTILLIELAQTPLPFLSIPIVSERKRRRSYLDFIGRAVLVLGISAAEFAIVECLIE